MSLDPFPFGGGVTMLESLTQNTPYITFPLEQSVLQLGDGFYKFLEARNGTKEDDTYNIDLRSNLVFENFQDLITLLVSKNTNLQQWLSRLRQMIKENKHYLFDGEEELQASVNEFIAHLEHANNE